MCDNQEHEVDEQEDYSAQVFFKGTIELTDSRGNVYTDNFGLQLEFSGDQERSESWNDNFFMSKGLRAAMDYVSDFQNNKDPFEDAKTLNFSINDYKVAYKYKGKLIHGEEVDIKFG